MKKLEIEIPQSWDEISVTKFQELQEVKEKDFTSKVEYLIQILSIMADVDAMAISGINIGNLHHLVSQMEFLQTPITIDKKDSVIIGKDEYKWKCDLNSLTLGEMVSIEQIIDLEELNYTMAYDVIMAVLLRKIKEDGTLEDFDADNFEKNRELFSQVPITDVNGMLLFFLGGGKHYIKTMEGYSVVDKKMKNWTKKNWKFWKK